MLDAMIAYSDNTATDLVTGQVGADRLGAAVETEFFSAIQCILVATKQALQ